MRDCLGRGCRDILFDICLDFGRIDVEDMSRHLPRNLATKRYVMSCRDICQDIWSHEREASSGAHLDENFKSRNQRNFVRLLPFDVNLLDLECHFRNLSAIIAPRCAFIPRAQRAEQNFSPVGPNVMSRVATFAKDPGPLMSCHVETFARNLGI